MFSTQKIKTHFLDFIIKYSSFVCRHSFASIVAGVVHTGDLKKHLIKNNRQDLNVASVLTSFIVASRPPAKKIDGFVYVVFKHCEENVDTSSHLSTTSSSH